MVSILLHKGTFIHTYVSYSPTYLYVHDTSIFYQHQDVAEIKNVLSKEFVNVF